MCAKTRAKLGDRSITSALGKQQVHLATTEGEDPDAEDYTMPSDDYMRAVSDIAHAFPTLLDLDAVEDTECEDTSWCP